MKTILPFLFVLIVTFSFGQKSAYSSLTISDSLKLNANAVVRLSQLDITIASQNSMTLKSTVVTTVLNELGLRNLDLSENYDKNTKISKIEATVYDAIGNEVKIYKRRDFKDTSVADGVSIFNDNRALYLDYTPIKYPFTILLETVLETVLVLPVR